MILLYDPLSDSIPFLTVLLLIIAILVFLFVYSLLRGIKRFALYMQHLWERSVWLYLGLMLLMFLLNSLLVIVIAGLVLAYSQ